MKKGLLATSALVGASVLGTPAIAGTPSIADNFKLSITGNIRSTIIIYDQDNGGVAVGGTAGGLFDGSNFQFRGVEESEIAFRASATTANGLGYGFQIEIQTQTNDTTNTDEAWAYIDSASFGRIELGDQDDAADRMMIDGSDAQAGRGGNNYGVSTGKMIQSTNLGTIDGASITRSGDASKIIYFTPRFSGFQLGFSYTPDTGNDGGEDKSRGNDFADVFGFGANYVGNFSGATVTLAGTYQTGRSEAVANEDLSIWGVGGKVDYSGFSLAAGYANSGDTLRTKVAAAAGADGGQWWNIGLKYTTGPWDFSIGYKDGWAANNGAGDTEATQAAVGATYRMAPGWVLAGDIVWFNFENRGETTGNVFTPNTAAVMGDTDGWLFVLSSTMTF